MSKLDLKESFDIEVQRREINNIPKMNSTEEAIMMSNNLAISGHTSINHQDYLGNTIDYEEGSNLIVTSGKVAIIQYIQGELNSLQDTAESTSTTNDATSRRYNRITLGHGGSTAVASTDTKLVTEFTNITSVGSGFNGGVPTGTGANDFNFVKDSTGGGSGEYNTTGATIPRALRCKYHATAPTTENFYMTIEDSGLTSVWYAKFEITTLDSYWDGTSKSVVINEAGIVNQVGYANSGSSDNKILARRTFTNKQVKDADTLTITWKITIK